MDTNKLLYWSPVFRWEIVDGCLKIELFNYGQQFSGLFPEFYFYTHTDSRPRYIQSAVHAP